MAVDGCQVGERVSPGQQPGAVGGVGGPGEKGVRKGVPLA